jgi:hypothetical protein
MSRPGPAIAQGNASGAPVGHGSTPAPQSLLKTLGRKSWPLLHGLSERWPCARCRPTFSLWMSGLHDAVNVRIGRNPFRPETWDRFRSGELERGPHVGCAVCRIARWGARLVAQVPKSTRFP